ncbi:MAG: GNAT family N-acetyltransferase [Propionibacteriaceae bacterium]|jgi:ribosomal protein S18 acetylase RimI-like enzyme|nr:GNAT family N-acetyltransferase [Propionibacteriaceae bacterium]
MLRSDALRLLDDPVFHADMIDMIRLGGEILQADDEAVVVASAPATVAISRPGDEASRPVADSLKRLLDRWLPDPCLMATAHDQVTADFIADRFGFDDVLPCLSAAFLGAPLPVDLPAPIRIKPLGSQWTSVVVDNYPLNGPQYAAQRVADEVMWGAFDGSTIAGFIGQHVQQSMGMLYVLPQYRHRGIARALIAHLANRIIAEKRTPYDHIVVGNQASAQLQRAMGFTISQRTLYWIEASTAFDHLEPLAPASSPN